MGRPLSARHGIAVVRITVAGLLVIHGLARLYLGIVDDFGFFLASAGFPLGGMLAWTITIVEVAGGLAMAAGRLVRPLAAWFAVQLIAGIVLVHGAAGWFVVGAGRNGAEYSVLLIVCLIVVAASE